MSGLSIRKMLSTVLSPGVGLRRRVYSGSLWVFGLKASQSLLNIARLLILARILAPNDFGLMGIALVTMAALEVFSQTGFQAALIQKKDNIYPYLNSAWTLFAIRAAALFVIMFAAAPYVAVFFRSPESEAIIRVMGFSMLFAGLSNIGIVFFKKDLEFRKESAYQLSGTLADFSVAIVSVLVLHSVWALVLGHVAGNATRFIMSFALHPFRPKLSVDLEKMRELWRFGRWITGSGIILFSIVQGVDAFVGRLLGAISLGLYQLANNVSGLPSTLLTSVVLEVAFPAYSKMQSNIEALRNAYTRMIEVTSLFIMPISGLIFVSANDFTVVILGAKWSGMIEPMKILSLCGLATAFAGLNAPILMAVRRPDVITRLSLAKLAIIAVLIYPATMEWGLKGTATAVLISSILITPNTYYTVIRKILNVRVSVLLKCIALPSVGTVVMCSVVGYLLMLDTSLFALSASILSGMLIYLGVTLSLERMTGLRAWGNIAEIMKNLSE